MVQLAVVGVTLLGVTKHARRNTKLHMYVARARFRKYIDAGLSRASFGLRPEASQELRFITF